MIELLRNELINSLEDMAARGHLLVVGEPGAGKSWMVKSFVTRRSSEGDGVVFLRAEDHAVSSLDELFKSIGTKDFVAALRAYPGTRKYLVIDSLDSLRAEASQRAFRDLIRIVQREVPNVKVLASMRTFDSRQSVEFQSLFPIKVDTPSNPLAILARHFVVPVFSESELLEAIAQDERLGAVVQSASSSGRALLRNPFNLWLIIHMLDAGASVGWLSTIQSDVQLLDQYWQFRIDSRDNGLARRQLLTLLAERMVNTNTLSVPLRDLEGATVSEAAYKQLLSDEILSKTESDRVAYTHNILFDFAVSRLLMDEKTLIPFVLAAPARSIFYRPSISYFMARLWFRDPGLFWQSTTPFFDNSTGISSIAAITPATVIYNVAQLKEEFAPLFALPEQSRARAITFILRAIQAFDGLNSKKQGLWITFLVSTFEYMDISFLNEIVALLEVAVQKADLLPSERISVDTVAVALIHWIWKVADREMPKSASMELTNVAAARLIPIVAKQYGIIPHDARKVLTEVLDRFGNLRASANEAFRVVSNLDAVIEVDPEFAANIFVRVLGFEETSDEPTHIGGAVLPLMSNRAQDFSMAHYILGLKYPLLLERSLIIAARTAVLSITAQVKLKESDAVSNLGAYQQHFSFRGIDSTVSSDRSDIWDQTHKDYTSLELFVRLMQSLVGKRKNGDLSLEDIRDVLSIIAEVNLYAVTWKRVLSFAAENVEILAAIADLLQIPVLLASPETTFEAGRAITKAFEQRIYTSQEQSSIEAAILNLSNSSIAAIYRDPLLIRNRLLGCIPEAMLSEASRQIVQDLKTSTGLPENKPFFEMGPVSYGADIEDGWLKRQGVQTEREDNQKLLLVVRPLKSFESKFANQIPPETECSIIAEKLWDAFSLVQTTHTADEKVVTDVLTTIAAVADAILSNGKLIPESDVVTKCKTIITAAATFSLPIATKDADASFDRPMWGPTPKIEAAQGVMHFLTNWGLDADMQILAETLSEDPSPAVRFQIAVGLIYLYERHRDFFWNIANKRLPRENATGVLVALARCVAHPHIARVERDTVLDWEATLLSRQLPEQRPEDIFDVIVDSLTQLYVYFNEDRANRILKVFEKDPSRHRSELGQMSLSASYYLARGIGTSNSEDMEIRSRANAVIRRVLTAADLAIGLAVESNQQADETELRANKNVIQDSLRLVENLVFRVYLSLGVNVKLKRDDITPLKEQERKSLFFELGPLWEALTTPIGSMPIRMLAAQTTHHLMELFSMALPYDPPRVLKYAAGLLRGHNSGYQFDSMAIAELVKFADVVLADHKDIMRDPVNASNLGAILSVFVEAGWSEATQLVMKLDSAVR